ncbi:hypothetical protein [Kaistia sp. 32K]|uniref:hypothetical protein n=1 Tax=Kaistia sp. 32K TaxID=2795690 RepID=UPI001915B4CE|nr:hypothetical protein [Kaistia sp. 32K]
MSSASAPWMKFYPRDWRADQALRAVSLAARGLWMECLCLMHEAKPYGHLLIAGQPVGNDMLSRMVGASLDEVDAMMAELDKAGVLSRTRNGVVYSRRMTKDFQRSKIGQKAVERRWSQAIENTEEKSLPNRYPNRSPITQKPEANLEKKAAAAESPPPQEADPPANAAAAALLEFDDLKGRERRRAVTDDAVALHRRVCAMLGSEHGYRNDLGEVVAWLQAGYGEKEILATIEAVQRRQTFQLPTSLRYFRQAIADSDARKRPEMPARRGAASSEPTPDLWRQQLRQWGQTRVSRGPDEASWPDYRRWNAAVWGPPPLSGRCRAPAEMLEEILHEFGIDRPEPAIAVRGAR